MCSSLVMHCLLLNDKPDGADFYFRKCNSGVQFVSCVKLSLKKKHVLFISNAWGGGNPLPNATHVARSLRLQQWRIQGAIRPCPPSSLSTGLALAPPMSMNNFLIVQVYRLTCQTIIGLSSSLSSLHQIDR